jgi:hypothetical protein
VAWQNATGYGRRRLVETAIGRDKRIIGSTLRVRATGGRAGKAAITVQVPNRTIGIAKPISVRPEPQHWKGPPHSSFDPCNTAA